MKRLLLGLVGLSMLLGCNNRIKKYAPRIEGMSMSSHDNTGGPSVSLGRLEAPGEGAGAAQVAAVTAGNMTIEVAEVELLARLDRRVAMPQVSASVGAAMANRMQKQGPFPVDATSRWRIETSVNSWGIDGDIDQAAEAWVSVGARGFGPKGRRIWSTGVRCERELVGYLPGAEQATQTALNIGMLRAIEDEVLVGVYDELAKECGRELAGRLNRVIQIGREKAARK